jgi:ribosomal-protein-alanine N-acetyltransferase
VDAVHAIYGSPKATEHLSFEPRTREQVAHLIAGTMVSATVQPRTEYNLAVCRADNGDLIGFARIARDPHAQQAATMGFALHPDAWGVGYGTETARALISLSLCELKLHRIWAARAPKKVASEKTLLSAGMTKEGRIRHHAHVRGATPSPTPQSTANGRSTATRCRVLTDHDACRTRTGSRRSTYCDGTGDAPHRPCEAFAKLGQVQKALSAIGDADDAFAHAQPEKDPPWMRYYDSAQHNGDTGHAMYDLALAGDDPAGASDAYGADVTQWAGYRTLQAIRELRMTTYAARHAATRPEWRTQAQHRADCFRGRVGPRPWRLVGIL